MAEIFSAVEGNFMKNQFLSEALLINQHSANSRIFNSGKILKEPSNIERRKRFISVCGSKKMWGVACLKIFQLNVQLP